MDRRISLFWTTQERDSEQKTSMSNLEPWPLTGLLAILSTGIRSSIPTESKVGSASLPSHSKILTQVVDSQVGFKAISCLGIWTHHHSCVVDQNMELHFLYNTNREILQFARSLLTVSHRPEYLHLAFGPSFSYRCLPGHRSFIHPFFQQISPEY